MALPQLIPSQRPLSIAPNTAQRLVELFFAGKAQSTIEGYTRDLRQFCRWLDLDSVDDAARHLLGSGKGHATAVLLDYRASMIGRLAPATTNRRLAAVRSMVKLAYDLDMIAFDVKVPRVKARGYKDTRGPAQDAVQAILATHRELPDKAKTRRDLAIFRMLADLGLRRSEVSGLSISHVDLEEGAAWILGKGEQERRRVTILHYTRQALMAWLEVHQDDPDAPLFVALENHSRGGRLSPGGIWGVVQAMGRRAGVKGLAPHKLRHSAVTSALGAENGDVLSVSRFSRHSNVQTVTIYNDNLSDEAGRIAEKVATANGPS